MQHAVEASPLTDERLEGASLHDVLLDSLPIFLPNAEAVAADRCCHVTGLGAEPIIPSICDTPAVEFPAKSTKNDKNVFIWTMPPAMSSTACAKLRCPAPPLFSSSSNPNHLCSAPTTTPPPPS